MAIRKTASKKAAPKAKPKAKPAAKAPAKKKAAPAKKKTVKVGAEYECSVCGLAVTVDRTCGCSACDIVCCGKPMKAA